MTSAIVGASTTIASAHHGPEMLPAQPKAWSSEKRPGLVAVTATAVAMISRLYSNPPAELKKPFFQWTVPIAFSITTVSASAANGVSKAEGEEQASAKFAETSDERHRKRGPEAQSGEERSRTGRPAAAEGAEQLLRPVRRQRQAGDDTQQDHSVRHLTHSLMSVLRGAADDHDRAERVLRALLADRAEQ